MRRHSPHEHPDLHYYRRLSWEAVWGPLLWIALGVAGGLLGLLLPPLR